MAEAVSGAFFLERPGSMVILHLHQERPIYSLNRLFSISEEELLGSERTQRQFRLHLNGDFLLELNSIIAVGTIEVEAVNIPNEPVSIVDQELGGCLELSALPREPRTPRNRLA